MTVLSVLGLAFLATARTEDTIASNYRNHTAAFYAAEAGLESGVASLKSLLGANPTPADADLAGLAPPALTDPSYTFDAFQVRRVRTVAPYNYQTTLSTGAYAGLNALTTDYVITATVRGPRGSQARLTQKVQHLQIPLFQFAAFYGKGVDLEITPNPPAVFTGRIHANSNLYMRENTDTKFDSYITSAGNIYRYVKPDPSGRRQNVQIKDASGVYQELNFDHDYDYDFNNAWSADDWKNAALSTFGGKVQDSAMGVQEIIPPIPDAAYDPANPDVSAHQLIEKGNAGDTPEMQNAKMYYKADIRIENGVVRDKDGNNINLNAAGCDKKAITNKTFYDPREMKNVNVTEIDIGELNDCGVMPANGILYAYDNGSNQGIRLKNGAELPGPTAKNPNGGLTVVSENPVYIMGDYNTDNKVPAAVMGDAIYVLSNNWEKNNYDKKGKDAVKQRPAADTTINAAVMLGPHAEAVLGDKSSGNGYFENIFRLLEDWRGSSPWPNADSTLTYKGSIVSLWHSQQAPAGFTRPDGVTYRRAPNRLWSYDTLFNTQIPPGTPMGIIITRGQWSEG